MRLIAILALGGLCIAGCTSTDRDSGWSVQELGTRAEFRDIFFVDEQRGWIVGGGHDIDGGILGRTIDGGRSWNFTNKVARPHSRASSFHLNAVWFVDELNGFVAGDGDRLLRTVDGGEHWHAVLPGLRVWAHFQDLCFADDRHGWALGAGGLVLTADGGATWTAAAHPAPRGRAVHFVDAQLGWIVGSGGIVRTSTDGGTSWTTLVEAATGRPDLWDVEFLDARRGWAVGGAGSILHTQDGGASWQAQTSGVEDTLMDVEFVDGAFGRVVGFERSGGSSVVLRTTDGGATWNEELRVPSEATRALFVLDASHAWAVGAQQRRGPDDGSQKLLRYEAAGG